MDYKNLLDHREHPLIEKTWVYPKRLKVKDETIKRYDEFFNATKNHDKEQIRKLFDKFDKLHKFDYPITKKSLYNYLNEIFRDEKNYNGQQIAERVEFLQNLGFMFHTFFPSSFIAEELVVPDEFKIERDEIVKDFKEGKITDIETEKRLKDLGKKLFKYFEIKNISLMDMAHSGTKGNAGDFTEMFLTTGLALDENGKLLGVGANGFFEGQTLTDYSNLSAKGYVAQYGKAIGTAEPGEVVAILNRLTSDIRLSKIDDCGSTKGLEVFVKDKTILNSIDGKMLLPSKKFVSKNDVGLIGKNVVVRSPFFCNAKDGVCRTCCSRKELDFHHRDAGTNLGLVVVSSVSTPLTELALKKSKESGSLNLEETSINTDSGLDKVDWLTLEKHKVITNATCKVIIDKNIYKNLDERATLIVLPAFEITRPNGETVVFDTGYDVNVMKPKHIVNKGKIIELQYREGDTIVDSQYKSTTTSMSKLKALLNHRLRYYKTLKQVVSAMNDIWQTLRPLPLWRSEIMLLNTYIEYIPELNMYKRTQLLSQDYSDKTKTNVVKSIKVLNHALADNAGYIKSGLTDILGLKYNKEKSDIEKVMFAKYDN